MHGDLSHHCALTIPTGKLKRKVSSKPIIARGGAGVSRRQAASLRSGGDQFPPLPQPKKATISLITQPRDRSMYKYVSDVLPRMAELSSRSGSANPYLQMVINPFEAEGHRYPDDTIVPTALVKLARSTTFTVDATGAASGFVSMLGWKVRDYAAGPPAVYTIGLPFNLAGAVSLGDYSSPQAAWRAVDYSDRTLAMAIRVRVMGLPTSSFLPSGTLYFLQFQPGELLGSFDTEAECVNAVTARKGFSITLAEVAKLGAIHCPFLPQGPMSFVFSGSNASGADGTGGTASSSAISPNGGLVVTGFGMQSGTVLRFDYAHHVEYIPGQSSAGLIETRVQLPSVIDREKISAGAEQVITSIAGGTSATDLAPIVVPHIIHGGPKLGSPFGSSVSSASSTVSSILETISGATTAATALSKLFA